MGICRHGYMSHGYMSPNPEQPVPMSQLCGSRSTSSYLFDTLVTDMVYGGMVSPVSVTVVQTSTSDGIFTHIHNGGWAFSLPLFLHQEHKCLGHERASWWQHLCKDQQLASHPGLSGPTKEQLYNYISCLVLLPLAKNQEVNTCVAMKAPFRMDSTVHI